MALRRSPKVLLARSALASALIAALAAGAGATPSDPLLDGIPSFDSPRPEAQPYELGCAAHRVVSV
jgi:hypothetical protein